MAECKTEVCEKRFSDIESRLNAGDRKFVELGCKIDSLISSQSTLTKALWGLAVSIFMALMSFVLGRI